MFREVTLHGGEAELLWGHRPAIALKTWRITKAEGQWTLTATCGRIDPFHARQRPLRFVAPRAGGYWAWPITSLDLGTHQLVAKLGPPER